MLKILEVFGVLGKLDVGNTRFVRVLRDILILRMIRFGL